MAKKKKVTFDKQNLEENAKLSKEANYMKIDEAKTPYYKERKGVYEETPSDTRMKEYDEIDSEVRDEDGKGDEENVGVDNGSEVESGSNKKEQSEGNGKKEGGEDQNNDNKEDNH